MSTQQANVLNTPADAEQSPAIAPVHDTTLVKSPIGEKKNRSSSSLHSGSGSEKRVQVADEAALDAKEQEEIDNQRRSRARFWAKARPFILIGLALLILGWWIASIILPETRPKWIAKTFWAWFFILVIAFRFIPNSVITRPVGAVWQPLVSKPFFSLSYPIRVVLGVAALLALILGSAFGIPLPEGTNYGDRAISVVGLLIFQAGFYLTSKHRRAIQWETVIVGLLMQQVVALFVLKTGAGFSLFRWIATAAADLLHQAHKAAVFFFDQETINKFWFFINVLASIIFFIALVQMFYYLGVMQWLIEKFAWFFFKTMNVSGAEAVVAAASPWVGQGESACLVKPYVDVMTDSEIHLTMTSGFSTIAGSVLGAYIGLGVAPEHLVTSSVMSIPASIAISKLRFPEVDEPVTRGQVVVDRGAEDRIGRPANALHAFSNGALFGVIVAGQILVNVLVILALIYTIDGLLLGFIGPSLGIPNLTLSLIGGYILYPVAFFMGVPRSEILTVSRLLATKLVANEFVAYLDLQAIRNAGGLSRRGMVIAEFALCGFANLASLGIQIGVLSALAPGRKKSIARLAPSAMLCGFISTMQAAGIAGMLV